MTIKEIRKAIQEANAAIGEILNNLQKKTGIDSGEVHLNTIYDEKTENCSVVKVNIILEGEEEDS